MGGLRKLMPITAVTFIVGWLAIAGVPPFAGLLVEGRDPAVRLGQERHRHVLWAIGLVTALLTAFYMSRQVFLIFFGEPAGTPLDGGRRAGRRAPRRRASRPARHGIGPTRRSTRTSRRGR